MGEILAEGWRLYRKHFAVVVGVVLVVYIPIELLSSYMDAYVFEEDDFRKSFRFARLLENFIGIIATAGVIFVGYTSRLGESPQVGSALSSGLQAWGRMFWTRLLSGLCILLGLILLVIPGIYLFVRLSLVEPVVCCEKISGIAAMRRSYELTEGRFWMVVGLGLVLLGLVLVLVAAMIVSMFVLYMVVPGIDNWLFEAATSLLIDVATAFGTLCVFVAYAQFTNELEQQPELAPPDVKLEGIDEV